MNPKLKRLNTMLKLAQQATEKAEKVVIATQKELVTAKASLQQIKDYQRDYSKEFQTVGQRGISIAQLDNYQEFLGKLIIAESQQEEAIKFGEANVRRALDQWNVLKSKEKTIEKLIEKEMEEIKLIREKREQKMIDELSLMKGSRKPVFE